MKQIFILCFMLFLGVIYAKSKGTELKPPYSEANIMPYNPQGWYAQDNQRYLEEFIRDRNVLTIVEIGSWMGQSTLHLGSILPKKGIIYAVDTWEGSPNENHSQKVLETLYDQFLSNVIYKGLTKKIVPVRMTSMEASKKINDITGDRRIDLIYLDATHIYEATYEDLTAWFPYVKGHGIFCGDDWAWGDGGVGRAVQQFAKENHLKACTNGWFWWLEE